MLAKYDEVENFCYICKEKTNHLVDDISLYFCEYHFIYIPLVRWQLTNTVQIYIPSNILCTHSFDIVNNKIDDKSIGSQIVLFKEDSIYQIRSFSPNVRYPIYVDVSDPNNFKVKMFYVIKDVTELNPKTVNVPLSAIHLLSINSEPITYTLSYMIDKIQQKLWQPIITEPLYSKIPQDVKKLIDSWKLAEFSGVPTLFKLVIRVIYKHDVKNVEYLPCDIIDKLHELPISLREK